VLFSDDYEPSDKKIKVACRACLGVHRETHISSNSVDKLSTSTDAKEESE
jgi:hypothetical protein